MKNLKLILITLFSLFSEDISAQNESDEKALLHIKDGISISDDSLFSLNLRFRMQNRMGFTTVNAYDFNVNAVEARVRRLRLRFDGFLISKKIRYYLQLSFSKADQDLENENTAQTVRDAILYYHFNKKFYLGFGQSKLPGNRERVTSSGNLQFADRSIANSKMTLDRDFGIFAYYTTPIAGDALINLKATLTTGDGRNASAINEGMAYTGRFEFLPFGTFKNNGDYSEGDLEFEQKPKLSLGATYCFNHKSSRTGGTLGPELYDYRDMTTSIVDAMFKYKGMGVLAEYFNRTSPNPITNDTLGNIQYIYDGKGLNVHLSQMVSKKWEVVSRYTIINPNASISKYEKRTEEIILGVNKYLNGHRIKVHGEIGYRAKKSDFTINKNNNWMAMFQIEFGI